MRTLDCINLINLLIQKVINYSFLCDLLYYTDSDTYIRFLVFWLWPMRTLDCINLILTVCQKLLFLCFYLLYSNSILLALTNANPGLNQSYKLTNTEGQKLLLFVWFTLLYWQWQFLVFWLWPMQTLDCVNLILIASQKWLLLCFSIYYTLMSQLTLI